MKEKISLLILILCVFVVIISLNFDKIEEKLGDMTGGNRNIIIIQETPTDNFTDSKWGVSERWTDFYERALINGISFRRGEGNYIKTFDIFREGDKIVFTEAAKELLSNTKKHGPEYFEKEYVVREIRDSSIRIDNDGWFDSMWFHKIP